MWLVLTAMRHMLKDTCVVVSYYDSRSVDDLLRLLRQLHQQWSAGFFDLRVVVNSDQMQKLELPPELAEISVEVRENIGFNIGAWHHGWRANPGYSYYIFLQDECEIVSNRWLDRYRMLLSKANAGLVGESLLHWASWASFGKKWPEAGAECAAIAATHDIELGPNPTHLQTLVLGATADCLRATDGFLLAKGKVAAIATEILFSRHCIQRGFDVRQTAWRPFEYIGHPQWASLRSGSASLKWNMAKAVRHLRQRQ